MTNTFYMVVVDSASAPQKRYDQSPDAHREAERLSFKEQKPAYVLQAIGRVSPAPPKMNWEGMLEAKPVTIAAPTSAPHDVRDQV